nr:hypothetical protein [Tanacetum cinerariifolium]
MTTLAEFMIIVGVKNCLPILDKTIPLIWPTAEENSKSRKKKYEELSSSKNLQADCDHKATNIVLQGLPPDVYAIVNYHKVATEIWDSVKLLMQGTSLSLQEQECKLYDELDRPLFKMAESLCNKFKEGKYRVMLESEQILEEKQLAFLVDPRIPNGQDIQTVIPHNATFKTYDLDVMIPTVMTSLQQKVVLMANLSNYDPAILSEIPQFKTYQNDMDNQNAAVQDTNSSVQQDLMILSVIEKMSEQMYNHVSNWDEANKETHSESLTAELERYKERVKTFEQRLNIDLSSHEKLIEFQMEDMIQDRLALKQQIDSLE